jgi:hypothetical protein
MKKFRIRNKMKQAISMLVNDPATGKGRTHTLFAGRTMLLSEKEISSHMKLLLEAKRITATEIPDSAPVKAAISKSIKD